MVKNENCLLYAVDRSGRVWYLEDSSSSDSRSSSITSTSGVIWQLLPNPTKVDIKRLSSEGNRIWGIGPDHQIYLFVHKEDIPIRVREVSYENQRWNPISGFSSQLLPTDRPNFSSEDGLINRSKDLVNLGPVEFWNWDNNWEIECTFEGELLENGWTYAVDFPANYHPTKNWNSYVRRRKWYRIRSFIGYSKWVRIDPICRTEPTREPFADVCVRKLDNHLTVVWAISILGQVYFRTGVTSINPVGISWENTSINKGQEACQVTISTNGIPFVVSWTGSCLYRVGITHSSPSGSAWIEITGPQGGLLHLSAGEKSLWAITKNKKCCVLKGNLQELVKDGVNAGFEWSEIPGKLKFISVSKNDLVVIGVGDSEEILYARTGVNEISSLHGQGWKEIYRTAAWDSISSTSSVIFDQIDKGNSFGSEAASLCSVRPDLPDHLELEQSDDSSSEVGIFTGGGLDVGLCWIDGSCLSSIKSSFETQLEIGEWRNEILNEIQSLKVSYDQFSNYSDAFESDNQERWKRKTGTVRIVEHVDRHSTWIKGELEIINNNSLVFHKNINHSWVRSLQDILSVFRTRELSHSLTLRIRNPIEAGVADFVSFKFSSEKELVEWQNTLLELTEKEKDKFTLGNIWLTTNTGELLEAGFFKIADSAVGADMIVPSDSGVERHHSLIKGFLPGSLLKIELTIPIDSEGFFLNLEGKGVINFHFNPRFNVNQVVRNTRKQGEIWGDEERDGVFPFQTGHRYTIVLECFDSHILTTVCVERRKFNFIYRHRLPPRLITNFSAGGSINILGIQYDPKSGEASAQPELVTIPAKGHFWKVESASMNIVWAISYDSNVWMYTGQKSNADNVVKDEQVCFIYENQRWNPLTGFSVNGLPTDRSPWSDESGQQAMEKYKLRLPSSKWSWKSDWEIDYKTPGGVDSAGWQYAIDFPASYHPSKRFNDFVRRRRWKRVCQFQELGQWIHVTGAKLIDLSVYMNEECDWEVLGVTEAGDAVVRRGITSKTLAGTNWEVLPSQKPFISASSFYGQNLWSVGKDGFAYIRYGTNWTFLDRPKETPLKIIRVGNLGVWAIGTNNCLYKRRGVQPALPEGNEWTKICDNVLQISNGFGNEVWALLKQGDIFQICLVKRIGMSKLHPDGVGWEPIAEGPWSHLSIGGAFRRS